LPLLQIFTVLDESIRELPILAGKVQNFSLFRLSVKRFCSAGVSVFSAIFFPRNSYQQRSFLIWQLYSIPSYRFTTRLNSPNRNSCAHEACNIEVKAMRKRSQRKVIGRF
jgi:hypothetical protein